MKKLRLLLAFCALLLGWSNASAQGGPTDKTSSVAAWTGGNYTSAQDNIALKENYVTNTTTTGNIFVQTVAGLDQGYYKVTLYANAIYTPERGFTSDASDFDSDRVFIFATGNSITKKTAVPVKYGIITTGSEAYTVNAYVGADGNLTIGLAKDKVGTNWHTIATKSLYFYGNDLSIIKAELNTEISTAEGLSVASSEEATLNAAIDAARDVYNSGTATFDEIDAAITTLKIAEKYALGGFSAATLETPVLTTFVVNGDFTSFTDNWPNGGWFTTAGVGNHGQMEEGSEKAWENYSWGGERLSGKMYFRMTDIPNGAYSVSIDGFSRTANSTYVYANKERVYLNSDVTYETKVIPVIVKNNILEIGEYSGKIDWMKIKKVSVSYTGDPLASYKNTIASLIETGEGLDMTGLPTSVSDAVDNAISTYKPVYASYTEEEECTAAISALQTSVQKAQAYINAKGTVDKMNNILDNTNVYTTDAYNTLYAYITKFNNAEYTNEEANALNGTIFGTGWRSTAAIDDFLVSAWDVAPRNWDSYHVNTWSTTGDSGNPNMYTPCIEYWTGDNSTLANKLMTATISGKNPGDTYKVAAKVCLGVNTGVAASTAPTGISLQLNDGEEVSVCSGARTGETRFYEGDFEASGIVGMDGNLYVKFNVAGTNVSWMTFRNVKYTLTSAAPAATDEQKTALANAINDAEANTLGFENGEYAPYNNVAAIEALATAKAIDPATATGYAVVTATTALTGATWTANDGSVECVYNGNFAEGQGSPAANIQQYGWTRTNGWGQFKNDGFESSTAYYNQPGSLQYGNAGVYTMPLKAQTIYRLQFKYAKWDGNFAPTVSVLNEGSGMAAKTFENASSNYKDGYNSVDMVFVTASAGNYVLSLSASSNYVITGVSITKAASQVLEFVDGSAVPAYAPGTYPSVKITRTLTAGKWATAVYPFAVSGVDNIAVLDSYDSEGGALAFTSAAASTANEPFFMMSNTNKNEITLSNVAVAAANATPATASEASLIGAYTATDITNAEKNYVLSNNQIFSVGDEDATINPYRAYIQLSEGGSARALSFVVDGKITGVDNVKASTEATLKDGKYLENGKVVIVKNGVKYNAAGAQMK